MTFTERISGGIELYARRTNRMLVSQHEVGFVAGGEWVSKIARKLALPTSPLSRNLRKNPYLMPSAYTPIPSMGHDVRKQHNTTADCGCIH